MLEQIRASVNERITLRTASMFSLEEKRNRREDMRYRLNDAQILFDYVKVASLKTQQNIESRVGPIVSLSLASIWDTPYGFKMNFVVRSNHTECELLLTRNNREIKAVGSVGGGVCDVLSFALRLAYLILRMSRLPTRRVLILDEPFRNLHGEQQQLRCSEMVKNIAETLNFQIIMISDVENINRSANNIINCRLVNGRTVVNQIVRTPETVLEQVEKRKLITIRNTKGNK